MLNSRILKNKKNLYDDDSLTDLIYSTFKFPTEGVGDGVVIVNEYEKMRPDLLADRKYGDHSKWDAMLKYNGISNPFSIETGQVLYLLPFGEIEKLYIQPRDIPERGEKSEADTKPTVDPNANKDEKRLANLRNKNNRALPPNLNNKGDSNIKIEDGKIVFGPDVTTVNVKNCPAPISRARLQAQLIKNKLFI